MRLLLDTNVYIYNFVDHKHVKPEDVERWKSLNSKSKIVFDYILDGKHTLIIPTVVQVEVASVINRMTKNEETTGNVMDGLNTLGKRKITEIGPLDDLLVDKSIALTYQSKLHAIDSIIGASCLLRASTLITNDKTLHDRMSEQATLEGISDIESIYLQETTEEQLHRILGPGLFGNS